MRKALYGKDFFPVMSLLPKRGASAMTRIMPNIRLILPPSHRAMPLL